MLIKLVLILLTSTMLTALITPFLRNLAIKNGLVDLPNDRKIHADAIPRLGGIAVFVSFFVVVWLAYKLFNKEFTLSPQKIIGLLGCGTVIFMLGVVDDIRGLGARQKLTWQILASFMLVFSGFLIDASKLPFLSALDIQAGIGFFIGFVLTVFWLVGITNAMNLIDGMDGLSSGVVIFASGTLFVVSILVGNLFVAIISLALLGGTVGFLFHNWHPAKIFIGDCGAMFLGFTLAALSIEISWKSIGGSTIFVPLLALGLPIVDTGSAILRRKLNHKPVFAADQEHIHHKLLQAGFSVRQAALILYGVCFLFGAAALATTFVSLPFATGIAVGMFGLSVVGIVVLGRAVEHGTPGKHE